ncbi:hypothetical protein F7725_009701 [Dissostichus mawsoni]|uniref:long-chain-fatty-acid--CoA ligase n=1 Tax=Dissostichus mawsoni TaxID=36200 RepID=A0A7J5XM56_DISMA|nr:hypothetical protein F7725_009701 [Dissostichus mawsoni]
MATRPKALPPVCDLRMQSVEVQGGELARRSVLLKGDANITHFYDDATTMYECFLRGVRVSNNGPFLGSRKPKQPYEWMSYREVMERSENLGSAFLHKGHSKTTDPHIGIFSQNRPEKVELVLDCVKDRTHSVKTIVLMGPPVLICSAGPAGGVHIISLQEMEAIGKANHRQPMPPRPEEMALICFTSGTTGMSCPTARPSSQTTESNAQTTSEDVLLSFLPLAHMFERVVEVCAPFSHSDVHISFLPLAHMFERVVQGVMIVHGARIGFFQGDIRLLSDDLNTLKPTIFGQANTSLKRWLLGFAYRRKESEIKRGIVRRDSIWDRLIFGKVQVQSSPGPTLNLTVEFSAMCPVMCFTRASLGGRVRLMLTGAAPIPHGPHLPQSCYRLPGHVGAPLPCNSLKLVDVSEMNYLAVNGEGEVCVKGPNVFQGYLKDPEKTAEAIDADGWLHTGDVGKWLPNGTLKIVDRKKHIFKLAQGEYIAPEKIENVYMRSDAVAQVFVHGDSLQACLVAVVVPDPDFLSGWTKRTLGLEGSFQELCGRAEVKAAIFEDMMRLGKEGGLKSFEQVKSIYVHTELFSIENGLLTPTLKAKRNEQRQYFRSQIDELYSGIKM